LHEANPFKRLDWLLRNSARFLKSWNDRFVGNVRLQLEITKEVVARLEMTRDRHFLAAHEESLHQRLKRKSLGLSSLQRTIARQESRLLWLKEGDAPTKFFHIHANAHHKKKFIRTFHQDGHVLVSEEVKAQAFFNFFDEVLGTPPLRNCSVNMEILGLPTVNLSQLNERFTEEEVWAVIKSLPPDKAPGPDGFTARFLQVAWPIIRPNIMAAFDAFWHLDTRNLHSVNNALLVLLHKSADAASVKDFRPISLIHVIGKLVSKVLSNRLAPRLGKLV
jgi:hypothetical protein